MIEKESNYIQQIYRIILFLIGLWFINLIWPYISDVILMLVFAFLFTTVLLSSVDAFERRIGNRGLSVLGVVIILFGGVSTFLGSFIGSKICKNYSKLIAGTVGIYFLSGGIYMTIILPAPIWFISIDLIFSYIPMAFLGWYFAIKNTKEQVI